MDDMIHFGALACVRWVAGGDVEGACACAQCFSVEQGSKAGPVRSQRSGPGRGEEESGGEARRRGLPCWLGLRVRRATAGKI